MTGRVRSEFYLTRVPARAFLTCRQRTMRGALHRDWI